MELKCNIYLLTSQSHSCVLTDDESKIVRICRNQFEKTAQKVYVEKKVDSFGLLFIKKVVRENLALF